MIKKTFQIFIVPFVLGLIALFLQFYVEQTLSIWILSKIFLILSLIAYLFAFPVILYSLKENLSIFDSYKKTKNIIFSLIFVVILTNIFIYGGTLFLIVPGIIFLAWFSFAVFVVIFEGKKGFSALWRSKEIAKGKFWKIYGRILLIGIGFGILGYLVERLLGKTEISYLFVTYLLNLLNYIVLWIVLFFLYNKEKEGVISEYIPSKLSKVFFTIPAILGTIIFLFFFIISLNVLFRDYDPYFDDSHMIMEEREVLEEGNLYSFLEEGGYDEFDITNLQIVIDDQSYYEFIVENPEKAQEIIEENTEVYNYFEKMASHTHFMSPLNVSFDDSQMSVFPGDIFTISRIVSFKVSYHFYEGRVEEGMDLFLKNIKVGKLFASDKHQHLINLLIGVGYQAIGYDIFDSIPEINISAEEAISYGEKLERLEIKEESLVRALQREYMMTAELLDGNIGIDELLDEDIFDINFLRSSFFFKPNQTKKEISKAYYLEIDSESGRIKKVENTWDDYIFLNPNYFDFYLYYVIKGNIIGEIIKSATLIAIDLDRIVENVRNINFKNRATRIILSLKAYENKKDELPEKLEDLVPEYIKSIPKDSFYEDKEIQYSKEKRIIYSQKKEEKSSNIEEYIFEF